MYRNLSIQFEQDDRIGGDREWIILFTSDSREIGPYRGLLSARRGFSLTEMQQAAIATGWVIERNGVPSIDSLMSCARLAEFLERMLEDYFDEQRKPTRELVAISEETAARYRDGDLAIPIFGYAWLDMSIREDLADAARCADLWSADTVEVDIATYRDRRIAELFERYDVAQTSTTPKMASSSRNRNSIGESKTG